MRARFIVVGALASALALFVWQALSHTLLPWHDATLREFTDAAAVTEVVAANAPERGVYVAASGIFAAVQIDPAVPDRTELMGVMLGRQAGINLIVTLLLAFLVAGAARRSPVQVALRLGILGLAAGIVTHVSQWNWMGIGPSYALVNAIDLAIGWGIVGLVLGVLASRMLDGSASYGAADGVRMRAAAG
jgi:hypothetical protein